MYRIADTSTGASQLRLFEDPLQPLVRRLQRILAALAVSEVAYLEAWVSEFLAANNDRPFAARLIAWAVLIWLIYEVGCVSRWGATVGRKATGIRVVRSPTSAIPIWDRFRRFCYRPPNPERVQQREQQRELFEWPAWCRKAKVDKACEWIARSPLGKFHQWLGGRRERFEARHPDRPMGLASIVRLVVAGLPCLLAIIVAQVVGCGPNCGDQADSIAIAALVALAAGMLAVHGPTVLDRKHHRGLHDRLAPTQVIKSR